MTNATDRLIGAAQKRLREFGIALAVDAPARLGPVMKDDAGIDAVVTLSLGNTEARYAVVVKDSMTLSSLAYRMLPTLPYPLLIIGDRISRRSASAFRDAGVQFVDALGNASIAFGSVLIDVQGRTGPNAQDRANSGPSARAHRPANIFSPRRSQVVLALLTWPELRAAKIRDIANAAGVSVGQAHNALAQLERAGFFVPSSGRLLRADDLLDYWTAAYPTGLGSRLDIAKYQGDPTQPVRRQPSGHPIYLSGESAEGTDISRPATLTMYVDALDAKMPIANRWSSNPDHTPNIFVRQKFWTPPTTREEGSATNAPWPLVYADLEAAGDARLRVVAKAWRNRCARPDNL